jgi:hypothetical protein
MPTSKGSGRKARFKDYFTAEGAEIADAKIRFKAIVSDSAPFFSAFSAFSVVNSFQLFPRQAFTQRPQMFWLIPAAFTSTLIWW